MDAEPADEVLTHKLIWLFQMRREKLEQKRREQQNPTT
jgi:hypothetical protein